MLSQCSSDSKSCLTFVIIDIVVICLVVVLVAVVVFVLIVDVDDNVVLK